MMPPTRGALFTVRRRIGLARHGHELLKRKHDVLIIEFFKILKLVRKEREALQREYTRAANMLAQARALESDLRIQSASLAVQRMAPVELNVTNIAGVRIPDITMTQTAAEDGGAAVQLYDSLLLQDVGTAYRNVLDRIVRVAAREAALRKVLFEIGKVKRRTKALSDIVIPDLEHENAHIVNALDEREREEFLRVKLRLG